MRKPIDFISDWISNTRTDSDVFMMWCVVAAMYRTGLCADCIINDCYPPKCNRPECSNFKTEP